MPKNEFEYENAAIGCVVDDGAAFVRFHFIPFLQFENYKMPWKFPKKRHTNHFHSVNELPCRMRIKLRRRRNRKWRMLIPFRRNVLISIVCWRFNVFKRSNELNDVIILWRVLVLALQHKFTNVRHVCNWVCCPNAKRLISEEEYPKMR